jgi:hypothetical protein
MQSHFLPDSGHILAWRGTILRFLGSFGSFADGRPANAGLQYQDQTSSVIVAYGMLTSHELFGFMSPALAVRIIESAHDKNKELYRAAMQAVAEARKLRPAFFERTPRAARHKEMAALLARPRLELVAANLLREWLMKEQTAMLAAFLDSLGVAHKDGAVDDLPASVEDAKLREAVETILAKYPPEEVAVYLNAFYTMNEVHWTNLESMLKAEPRLQFGG